MFPQLQLRGRVFWQPTHSTSFYILTECAVSCTLTGEFNEEPNAALPPTGGNTTVRRLVARLQAMTRMSGEVECRLRGGGAERDVGGVDWRQIYVRSDREGSASIPFEADSSLKSLNAWIISIAWESHFYFSPLGALWSGHLHIQLTKHRMKLKHGRIMGHTALQCWQSVIYGSNMDEMAHSEHHALPPHTVIIPAGIQPGSVCYCLVWLFIRPLLSQSKLCRLTLRLDPVKW